MEHHYPLYCNIHVKNGNEQHILLKDLLPPLIKNSLRCLNSLEKWHLACQICHNSHKQPTKRRRQSAPSLLISQAGYWFPPSIPTIIAVNCHSQPCSAGSQNHRIFRVGLEGTHEIIQFQSPAVDRGTSH